MRFEYPRLNNWSIGWVEFVKDCLQLSTDLQLDWNYVTCTSFAAQGIEAITGHNPFDEGNWADVFKTPQGAAKEILRRGYENLDQVIEDLFPEIPVGMAWPGDVVLVKTSANWCAPDAAISKIMPHGVALVDHEAYLTVTPEGLARGNLFSGDVYKAFAIGGLV